MLNPLDVLAQGAKLNPQFTRVAAGAVVLVTVVAIAKGYFGDDWMTPLYGSVIVLCALFLVIVVANLERIRGLETTIVWFIRALLLAIVILIFSGLSFVVFGFPPNLPCTVRFNAAACTRYTADPPGGGSPSVPDQPPPQAAAMAIRGDYTVYIQFAGFSREAANAARDTLNGLGWRVPGAERLAAASGLREIRYRSDTDKDAADLLAADLRKSDLPEVKVRKVGIITRGTLELWVGQ